MPRQCFLRCLLDKHAPIKLPHDVEIILGRNKLTKIKDTSCSRQQLSFKADCEKCLVELKQLGVNNSGLDGCSLKKDVVYKVEHGARIEILLNHHFHIVEFDPPPEDGTILNQSVKRKLSDESPLKGNKPKKANNFSDMTCHTKVSSDDVWDEINKGALYTFTSKGVLSSPKIAAFDMDGTLINTKSGKVHPTDINDWQIAFPTVPKKLKELIDNGFKVVLFSNQAPIGNGRVRIEDFKLKIKAIVEKLNVPLEAYIATGKDIYRKPSIGMWNMLTEKKNDDIKIDMDESFYCGDAVGRLANWAPGKKKDHSMADKLFANNIGVKFFTPEQFFLGHSVSNIPIGTPEFDPSEVLAEPFNDKLISKEQEVIVLIGFPGSGKSFISKQIEAKSGNQYVAVCRDVLGSWQKCVAEATKLLKMGKSVIVDSTNPDIESRARWTALAKELNVVCRCAKMAVSKAHAQHNNKFRQLMKINHVPVNDIVFHSYKNKYVEPVLSEGFKEIIEVKFNPCFNNKEAEKLYRMHLLEK